MCSAHLSVTCALYHCFRRTHIFRLITAIAMQCRPRHMLHNYSQRWMCDKEHNVQHCALFNERTNNIIIIAITIHKYAVCFFTAHGSLHLFLSLHNHQTVLVFWRTHNAFYAPSFVQCVGLKTVNTESLYGLLKMHAQHTYF